MIDKTGTHGPWVEITNSSGGGQVIRVPIMSKAQKDAMILDLYQAGWSYRLIAQLTRDESEDIRNILTGE
jgi:hypothetical protein